LIRYTGIVWCSDIPSKVDTDPQLSWYQSVRG